MNILITSAGQRVSLVNSFKRELSAVFAQGKVFTTDSSPMLAPACQISDKYFEVPSVLADNYISVLLKICRDNAVKMVIPTIDTELKILSLHIDNFKDYGIDIIISSPELVEICRDKRRVNELFVKCGIDIPKQMSRDNLTFPLFIKPYDGSCSKGILTAYTRSDITDAQLDDDKLMFMALVDASSYDEFTVDCYYDKKGVLKCVVPRQRIAIRAGEVSKGLTRNNIIVSTFVDKLANLTGARGCLTIQVFLHKTCDKMKAIEINPRFGGGYPLTYLSGANYTKWLIDEYLLGQDIESFQDWQDNLLMLRYDAEVLVENYYE